MLEPKIKDGLVGFGTSYHNLDFMGLTVEEFLNMHNFLVDNFNLRIIKTKFHLGKKTIGKRGNKKESETDIGIRIPVFEMHCMKLHKEGFDISKIIQIFNKAQRDKGIDEPNHAFSLTRLCYVYHHLGYDVKLGVESNDQKSPDLWINGISADLKVRREGDLLDRMFKKAGLDELPSPYQYKYDIGDELALDIGKSISGRLKKGSEQADMLFFDFGLLLSLGRYQVSVKNKIVVSVPPLPKKYRVVFFSANDILSPKGILEYPYLWTFIDFQPLLWALFNPSKSG